MLLAITGSCGVEEEVGSNACNARNHCHLEDGAPTCDDGFTWEDPSDPENLRCIEEGCRPESDRSFCERLGAECGLVASFDNCGASRSVECGACSQGQICEDNACISPECGNGIVEAGEECDEGPTPNTACDYGIRQCTVCDSTCRLVAGSASYCGDGRVDSANGEACDVPGDDGLCDYGQRSCQVCNSTCDLVAGRTAFCGDGVVQPRYEDCDGEFFCGAGCALLGREDLTLQNAYPLIVGADGSFSFGPDMVHGPGFATIDGVFYFEAPDYFVLPACLNGTITVRIEFDNDLGDLNLRVGRRPQQGGSGGPPPVLFDWDSSSRTNDFEEITVAAPTTGSIEREHYIRVEAWENSPTYIRNVYTLTGSQIGCD